MFSYNDRALLAWCPRHTCIQSAFNLIVDILVDIHVIVNRQLSKTESADQSHLTVLQAQSAQLIEVTCLLVLIDCSLGYIMKRPCNKK